MKDPTAVRDALRDVRESCEKKLAEAEAKVEEWKKRLASIIDLLDNEKELINGQIAKAATKAPETVTPKITMSNAVRTILQKYPALSTADIAEKVDADRTLIPRSKTVARAVAGVIFAMKRKVPPEIVQNDNETYSLAPSSSHTQSGQSAKTRAEESTQLSPMRKKIVDEIKHAAKTVEQIEKATGFTSDQVRRALYSVQLSPMVDKKKVPGAGMTFRLKS